MKSGQAMVLVILVGVMLTSVVTLSVTLVTEAALASSRVQGGRRALVVAESGAEEGLLRLLRNPSLEATGMSLTVGGQEAIVDVTGTGSKTITSTATVGEYLRRVEVQASFVGGQLTITSWREL